MRAGLIVAALVLAVIGWLWWRLDSVADALQLKQQALDTAVQTNQTLSESLAESETRLKRVSSALAEREQRYRVASQQQTEQLKQLKELADDAPNYLAQPVPESVRDWVRQLAAPGADPAH